MVAVLTFDVAAFRRSFPQFGNQSSYPNDQLQGWWDDATCYVSDNNCGVLRGKCRSRVINLIAAHIGTLLGLVNAGQTPGIVNSATVDKVSVSLTPPPEKNQWQWWLNQTGYGQQALALLQVKAAGGLYIPGLPETSAFRKVYGIFSPWQR